MSADEFREAAWKRARAQVWVRLEDRVMASVAESIYDEVFGGTRVCMAQVVGEVLNPVDDRTGGFLLKTHLLEGGP
jgi:hypothetical protein